MHSNGNWMNDDQRSAMRDAARVAEKEQAKLKEAFEIMTEMGVFPMRVSSGWTVWCTTPHQWPACLFGVAKTDLQFVPSKWPGPWNDPATALIEAKKWYTEHVKG